MRRHRAVFGVGDEAGFDEARFVITDAYTGGSDALKKTFESRAKTSRRAIQGVLRPRARLRAGATMSCRSAASISPAPAAICCAKCHHGSLPALLAAGAVLALQRLVLPVFHWIDDSRAFGSLRPRLAKARDGR